MNVFQYVTSAQSDVLTDCKVWVRLTSMPVTPWHGAARIFIFKSQQTFKMLGRGKSQTLLNTLTLF